MAQIFTKYILFIFFIFSLISCQTSHGGNDVLWDPKEVTQLSNKLGVELSNTHKGDADNMLLYAESAAWMGVPYRYGGTTKRGVDCSGFVYNVFNKVYRVQLPHNSADMASKKNIRNVSKGNLQTGDLVFFATTKSKSKISHVGIYLKEGRFVHASTSKGVIVSALDEKYYKERWIKGGRVAR